MPREGPESLENPENLAVRIEPDGGFGLGKGKR